MMVRGRIPRVCHWVPGGAEHAAPIGPEAEHAAIVLPPHIRDLCNLGYATGCPHLPASRDWDAVRFSIASASAEQITLCYVCELGHAPVEAGTLPMICAARPGDMLPRTRACTDWQPAIFMPTGRDG